MNRAVLSEGEMSLPEGWRDESVTRLTLPHSEGELEIVVVQLPAASPPGAGVTAAVDEHLAGLRRGLARFQLLARETQVFAGRAGEAYAIAFHDATGAWYRRFAAASPASDAPVTVLAIGGPAARSSAVDELFAETVGTLRWREEPS
jgi:hypothetical protein